MFNSFECKKCGCKGQPVEVLTGDIDRGSDMRIIPSCPLCGHEGRHPVYIGGPGLAARQMPFDGSPGDLDKAVDAYPLTAVSRLGSGQLKPDTKATILAATHRRIRELDAERDSLANALAVAEM